MVDIVVEETVVASAQCLEEALLLFGVALYVFNQKVSRLHYVVHRPRHHGAAGRINSDGGRAEKSVGADSIVCPRSEVSPGAEWRRSDGRR